MTTLITTVVTMSSIAQLWDDEWEMVFISLQVSCLQGCFSVWGKRPVQLHVMDFVSSYCIKLCLDVYHSQNWNLGNEKTCSKTPRESSRPPYHFVSISWAFSFKLKPGLGCRIRGGKYWGCVWLRVAIWRGQFLHLVWLAMLWMLVSTPGASCSSQSYGRSTLGLFLHCTYKFIYI